MILPKEHGAYGQLLFPLGTALAVGRPGAAALAFAASAVAAFVSHESLLVILGQRGARAAREQGVEARRTFALFSTIAIASGGAAIALMTPLVRRTVAVPAALGAVLAVMILRRREHTTPGEIVSALAMSALALPVALASGASTAAALTCVLAYAAAFLVATLSVRAVILVTRKLAGGGTRLVAAAVAVLLVALLALLPRAGVTSAAGFWAALPICAVGVALVAAMPSPRHLREIGWTLVGATAVTAVILIVGLRLAR